MLAEVQRRELRLSSWQRLVLAVTLWFDLALVGGRGGGKSWLLAVLALRHGEMYGCRARVLIVRQSFPGLQDLELITRELFGEVYGGDASYNGASHVWRLPGGGTVELGCLSGPQDWPRYQGRSFNLIAVDEAQQFADPGMLDLLRSNLRGPAEMPLRFVIAANPGGAGHHWLSQRYVYTDAADWTPFTDPATGRTVVRCPSTYRSNPYIDRSAYADQLRAATATDPGLQEAWLSGDWSAVTAGAFFGGCISSGDMTEPWPLPREAPGWWSVAKGRGWRFFLAYDHGSARPAVALLLAESPGGPGPDGRPYPSGSLVAVDELALLQEGSLNTGLRWTVPEVAAEIRRMCERWGVEPVGVADAAIFAAHGSRDGSLGEEFRRAGVRFEPSRKGDRVAGWEILRRMLKAASTGALDEPGLYLSRLCRYCWSTLPTLPRDARRPEDVDTRAADHGADALRYGCLAPPPYSSSVEDLDDYLQ